MTRTSIKRVAIRGGATLVALTAFVGFLHTPAGRPLLARVGIGCPIKASAEDVEHARLVSVRATRGDTVSPARPALGFQLDTMTLADVNAWADRNHVSCDESRSGSLLRCKDVPTSAIGGSGPKIDELAFGFTPKTKILVNLTSIREGLDSAVAATEMNEVASDLKSKLGAPSLASGSRSATYLGGGVMHTAMLEYRFSDYIADVSATNLSGHDLMLREHYMSARD
jgi:hypothetical protein